MPHVTNANLNSATSSPVINQGASEKASINMLSCEALAAAREAGKRMSERFFSTIRFANTWDRSVR
jgi:hypothetical protein